jgi:ABC-type uncharacterized transport system substrate-binding protein
LLQSRCRIADRFDLLGYVWHPAAYEFAVYKRGSLARSIGVYAGRVLNGVKPTDLPVIETVKFQFVINLRTAKSLGAKISDNLLSLADEVIE